MPVIQSPVEVLSDARGFLFEPLEAGDIPDKKNVHIVVSRPGVVRGNHYHMRGAETIVVMGPAQVRFRENDVEKDVEIPEGRAVCFVFPPGVPHAIRHTGDSPGILVAFNTIEHDRKSPDTVSEILL
jgi:dTDP-4-dehydrorhamnose 3,5-epimerase-like enzyme